MRFFSQLLTDEWRLLSWISSYSQQPAEAFPAIIRFVNDANPPSSVIEDNLRQTRSLPSIGMSVLLAGYYPPPFQQFLVRVKHHPGHHSSLSSSCAVFFFSSSSSLLYFSLLSF
jgi:hypothetical protein